MRSRWSSRFTFLLCLLVSAGIHAALFHEARRWTFGDRPSHATRPTRGVDYKVAPPGTVPDPPPPKSPFGEAGAVGDAFNSSPGDTPQMAPDARQDQAVWTRDAAGPRPGESPSPKPAPQAVTAPPPTALPTPPVSKLPAFRRPPPPQPQAPVAEDSRPTPPATPSPPAEPDHPAGGTPKPHSDQDSDLFAKQISVEFKRGRVVARPGRQVKFTRPQVNLAMLVQSAEIRIPARLKLGVTVTPAGRPRDVRVIDSTDSPSIDRAFLLAAYESWFEPAKDAAGLPVEDVVEFNVSIE